LRTGCFVVFLRGLITRELALQDAQWIGAGAYEIALRVLHLVGIEFQLSLHQVDLLLQSISLGTFESRLFLLEVVDHLLVRGDLRLRPAYAGEEFLGLRRGLWRMLFGLAHGHVKREVHFVIGKAECLLRKTLLIGVAGLKSQTASCFERLLIDKAAKRTLGHRLASVMSHDQASEGEHDEEEQSRNREPVARFHD
jgi:hypothetical protein